MDLQDLEKKSNNRFNDTFDYTPFNPLNPDELLDFTITIKSAKKDECKRFLEQRTRQAAVEQFNANRAGKPYLPNLKDIEKADIDFACKITEKFNNLQNQGKPYGETQEEIRNVYNNFEWLIKQVISASVDDANFLQA